MPESSSDRHLAENEVIFRDANEELRQFIKEHNKTDDDKIKKLRFLCECSNFTCREHIELSLTKYEKIHRNSSQFIVKPGHEMLSIERIVSREPDYFVVEKFMTPPKV